MNKALKFSLLAIVLLLRSYLAAVLAVTIPLGFVAAFLFGTTSESSRGQIALGAVVILVLLTGVIGFAPEMVAEIDTQFTDLSYINKIRRKLRRNGG